MSLASGAGRCSGVDEAGEVRDPRAAAAAVALAAVVLGASLGLGGLPQPGPGGGCGDGGLDCGGSAGHDAVADVALTTGFDEACCSLLSRPAPAPGAALVTRRRRGGARTRRRPAAPLWPRRAPPSGP